MKSYEKLFNYRRQVVVLNCVLNANLNAIDHFLHFKESITILHNLILSTSHIRTFLEGLSIYDFFQKKTHFFFGFIQNLTIDSNLFIYLFIW